MNYKLNRLNKYLLIFLTTTTTILFLNGCGGSSGSGGDSGGNEISTEFSYSDVRVLKDEAITTTSPEWVGNNAPESIYSIAPDLPAGISIDENTGDITGTHATSNVATPHTVTATPTDGGDGIGAKILVIVFETRPADKAALKVAITAEITANGDEADLSIIDTSLIEDMNSLFENKGTFNGDISKWDTSKVTDMRYMFNNASAFNQPIGGWDTSKVTKMRFIFSRATAFNQPIRDWDTSKVTKMNSMFDNASAFNQPIGDWKTSEVTGMLQMFYKASAFNQPIGDWITSNVEDMTNMFESATAFNQNLENWDASSAKKNEMFKDSGMTTLPSWYKP